MRYTSVTILLAILAVFVLPLGSAMVVQSVQSPPLEPGKESPIIVTLTNTLEDDVEDVSFALIFDKVPFISVGGSEKSTNELREGRDKDFSFLLKPSYDAQPGDYQIPYQITYRLNEERFVRQGTIGVHVGGNPELRFTLDTTTPVIGMNDELTLSIVNDGLADARFVSVNVRGEGITILSDKEVYIGSVDSDDFETASFDVIYTKPKAALIVVMNYRDLDNQKISVEERIALTAYSREDAIARGIIQQSYTKYYILLAAGVIILWFVWRAIRKRRRARLSAAR